MIHPRIQLRSGCPTELGLKSQGRRIYPGILQKNIHKSFKNLNTSSLSKFRASVKNHVEKWKSVYYSNAPELEDFPQPLDKLSGLERLAVLRCIRPDKVIPAARAFISENMSKRYVEAPTFDLLQSWKDSTPITPLVFILSPGVDPMSSLVKFSEGKTKQLISISLGQGQVIKIHKNQQTCH